MVDPSSEEEMCSGASIIISVMPSGKISTTVKIGYGSLQPSTLSKTLEVIVFSSNLCSVKFSYTYIYFYKSVDG